MSLANFLKLIAAIVITNLAGLIGSLFTMSAIPTWYAALNKPAFNPPSWVFGPVWTALYILMGVAAFLVWRQGLAKREVRWALVVFIIQLILNALWSIIFFGWHNPGLAFLEIIFLWLAIILTIVLFSRISRPAAYLLLPYILWVSFAGFLNYTLWQLNKAPQNINQPEQIACTMEAKLCPDGSAVGRSGPNCEFSPCPEEADSGGDVKLMTCYDRGDLNGRDEEPIPCRQDEDCTPSQMRAFCAPAEVGFFECGDRDFCGADGFCRHDCRL